MTRNSSQDLKDLGKRIFGDWLDVRWLWRDRNEILFNPIEALDGSRPLHDRAWAFAVKALLLPAGVVAATVASVTFFIRLPPSGIEQRIERQQNTQQFVKNLAGLFDPESPTDVAPPKDPKQPSARLSDQQIEQRRRVLLQELSQLGATNPRSPDIEQQTKTLLSKAIAIGGEKFVGWSEQQLARREHVLLKEIGQLGAIRPRTPQIELQLETAVFDFLAISDKNLNRVKNDLDRVNSNLKSDLLRMAEGEGRDVLRLKAVGKLTELQAKWQFVIMSMSLLLSARVFRWLIRRTDFEAADEADTLHLYFTGAALLIPNFVFGVSSIAVDLGVRYEIPWVPWAYVGVLFFLVIWVLTRLWSIASLITVQLRPVQTLKSDAARRIVASRLVLANVISNLVVNLAVVVCGTPIVWWFVRHPA
jgi:hypothetical protein